VAIGPKYLGGSILAFLDRDVGDERAHPRVEQAEHGEACAEARGDEVPPAKELQVFGVDDRLSGFVVHGRRLRLLSKLRGVCGGLPGAAVGLPREREDDKTRKPTRAGPVLSSSSYESLGTLDEERVHLLASDLNLRRTEKKSRLAVDTAWPFQP